MPHYSAGYTNTTNHFVIQNLPFFSQKVVEEEKTKFAFLLRFLQRSLVMPLPMELAERFNTQNNQTENYIPLLPLQISEKHKYTPKWKFEEQSKQNSSEKAMRLFLRERLQSYLPEWGFLEFLFWANAPLSEVLQQEIAQDDINKELKNTVVNFYLPIAELAVLIVTSSEEREKLQKIEQKLRSKGIYVVSFTAEEILEETDLIREKMEWIRHQVEKPIFSNKLREWNRISTNQPRETIIQQVWWKAALIRIQILTAELFFRGVWKLDDKGWNTVFLMREREQIPKEIIELAIKSIHKLIFQLFPELSFNTVPKISITTVFSEAELDKESDTENNTETLKIDFSILHRWTDSDKNKNWIKIRNDYAENYRFTFHSDEGKPLSRQLPIFSHSFFKAKSKNNSATNFYKWNFENNEDIQRSQFLLDSFSNPNLRESIEKNQSSFLQILLAKALNGQSVLANLPLQTDSSCIFGWLSVLQSLPSLLVCASTDVALDKMEELSKNGIDKVTVWHSEMSSQEIEQTQDLIKENKVFLLILTADLLNTKAFIDFISDKNDDKKENKINWAYFLVDEIHRFSGWSPQHKEEYIALERIYYNYFYTDSHKTPFVFLSHFLDKSVSKSIQNTFKVEENDFYAAVSATKFLENKIANFEFIETENTYSALVNLLKTIQNERQNEENTGIIFTSGVNGSTGSYLLSERLEFDLKQKVYPYSVEIPNDSHDDKETHFIKRNFLKAALKNTKTENLLVASTTALSSGINLENLDFIIQYGLPKSLTELLDISNRTKKQTAKTYIIFQKEKDEKTLQNLFETSTKLSDIRNMHREVSWLGGDMYRHLLEWAGRVEPVQEEVDFMKQFYDKYCLVDINEVKNTENKIIRISEVEISDLDFRVFSQKVDRKLAVERTIIRFYQMGILSNWEYSTHISNTKFKIWVQTHDQTSVRSHIFAIINTHESNFEIHKDEKYSAIFSMKNYSILEKYSFLFLQWIHENSIYHFKNNLKEVYEYAKSQVEQKEPKTSIFSEPFLHHSSINRLLYFIEKEVNQLDSLSKQEIDWIFEDIDKMNTEEKRQLSLDFVEKWRKRIPQNTILDFYKAILELHLMKFDAENAPQTLFSSVKKIIKGTILTKNLDYFIEKYVSFGNNLPEEAKSYLSESILINEFEKTSENGSEDNLKNKHTRATQIYSSLKDIYSLTVLLQVEVDKMKIVQLELQGT